MSCNVVDRVLKEQHAWRGVTRTEALRLKLPTPIHQCDYLFLTPPGSDRPGLYRVHKIPPAQEGEIGVMFAVTEMEQLDPPITPGFFGNFIQKRNLHYVKDDPKSGHKFIRLEAITRPMIKV